jgi:hypothetical protein
MIVILALAAGLLISICNFSVILILIAALAFWLILEKFECALLILVFYLPFQIALNLSAGFDVASGRVLILLFFTVWLAHSLKNKELEIDFSLQTLLISAFLFIATFSLLEATEMDAAIRKLLVFFSVFPLYFIITSLAPTRQFIARMIRALIFWD